MAQTSRHESGIQRGERQVLQALDNYAAVFVLIVLAVFATALIPPTSLWVLIPVTLQVGTLLIALRASGVRPARLRVAAALSFAVVVMLFGAAMLKRPDIAVPLYFVTMLGLTIGAMSAIIVRLARQPKVDQRTVMGALCVYLLIGLFYATLFGFLQRVHGNFFVQTSQRGAPPATPADFLYFSYTTLTTVGYGDFTAATSFGRMTAISEALIGQLYLVTVVSLVVANLGRQREGRLVQSASEAADEEVTGQ